MTPADLRDDPWAFGPWCWVVDRVELLPEPVPCRGMQGLWPVDDGAIARALWELVPDIRVWSALTLLQPYASAIAIGPKRIENRPWRRRIPAGGLWIGLHAGAALYCPDEAVIPYRECGRPRAEQARDYVEGVLDDWREVWPLPSPHWTNAPTVAELPLGCMLGAIHIAAILPYPESP